MFLPVCALPADSPIACPWCGQLHARVRLRRGDTSKCVRCGAPLARGHASNWIVTLAWALTGLILWVPANFLPLVGLSQLGNTRESVLFDGIVALWQHDMPWIALLVAFCGLVAPLLLLLSLTALLTPLVLNRPAGRWRILVRWLRFFEAWSLPEVYFLAVLVAFIKLGTLVHIDLGAGLWCHAVMSLALLIAWRRFDLDAVAAALAAGKSSVPVT